MVADADGSNITQVTPDPMLRLQGWMWSPDGSAIAIASKVARYPTISIAASDGSGIRALELGFPADTPSFRPDGTLLVRGQTARGTGLFSVSLPEGTAGDPIALSDTTSAFYAGDRGINNLMGAVYSRDGSRITYIQGQIPPEERASFFSMGFQCPSRCYGGPMTRNHVMNADGTNDRLVELSPESDYEDGGWFSPDGTRLLMGVRKGDRTQVAIVTLDGSRPPVSTALEADSGGTPSMWSPDGTRVLAVRWVDGTSSLIDPDTVRRRCSLGKPARSTGSPSRPERPARTLGWPRPTAGAIAIREPDARETIHRRQHGHPGRAHPTGETRCPGSSSNGRWQAITMRSRS